MIFLLLPALAIATEVCLLDCRDGPSDSPYAAPAVKTLLGASIGSYSLDFNETCVLSSPVSVADVDPTSDGYFEFSVLRTSAPGSERKYHGACGSNMTSFGYLNASKSGAILNGEYTYTCSTTDFYPDNTYLPLPASRNQTCVFGLQLLPALPNQFGAAFWTTKQPVTYGFDTTFRFRVLRRSRICPLLQSANSANWCFDQGGRGFAFIIQNDGSPGFNGTGDFIGYKVSTVGRVGLGYDFPRNLAIEFDYYMDGDSSDPNWNHIAVMVPVSKQPSEGDNSNSADHKANTLAIADGVTLPPLNEGTHKVRVTYEVTNAHRWQHMVSEWYSRPLTRNQQQMFSFWSNSRPGLLSVFLNDKPVIRTLVDLAQVVQTDSVSTYSAEPSSDPNTASPGSAWVGFVASTGSDNVASPVILDWRFTPSAQCPGSDDGPIVCSSGKVMGDQLAPAPRFTLRNIGRSDIRVLMSLTGQTEATACANNQLAWNQIHPYFLGCQREVEVGPQLSQLSISDIAGVRSVVVTDPALINRDYVGSVFLRRQIPDFCVIEHDADAYRLYFAACDCEYCARVFDNQQLYSVFYSEMCFQRYTYACSCFEVSQMSESTFYADYETRANPWAVITEEGYNFSTKTMQFQRHSICRGCKFDSHCSLMNKAGVCDTPSTVYRVGNPLKPIIGGLFQDWNRGPGAEDGVIKGSACDCNDRITEEVYLTTRNTEQAFDVYLLAFLQGSAADCAACLRIPGAPCINVCGTPSQASYLHHPSGQGCSTCVLASASLLDVTSTRQLKLRTCIYAAIGTGSNPWDACVSTVESWILDGSAAAQLNNFLNGVATHFLSECPGRDWDTDGAVCVPNLAANSLIPMQVLSRGPALESTDGIWFPVWWDGVSCLNAVCELVPRSTCYQKLYKFVFSQSGSDVVCTDLLGSGTGCNIVSAAGFNATNSTLVLNKTLQTYGYTDALNRSLWSSELGGMVAKSLEAWVSVDAIDTVSDLVRTAPLGLSASASWGDDYKPAKAVDGDMSTFWQSTTSTVARFTAIWELDYGDDVQNVQGYVIYWAFPPVDFAVQSSMDGIVWTDIDVVEGNSDLERTESPAFFAFTKFRIVCTLAGARRPAGQDANLFAYGIREVVLSSDLVVSRLKPSQVVQYRSFPAEFAVDSDLSTWWSTPRGENAGNLTVSTSLTSDLVLVRAVFRRGFAPVSAAIDISLDSGSNFEQLDCASVGCISQPDAFSYILSLSFVGSLTAPVGPVVVRARVEAGSAYYDDSIVQISELEMYATGTSGPVFTPTSCVLNSATSNTVCPSIVSGGTGTLAAGSTAYFSMWTSITPLSSSETLGIFTVTILNAQSVAASITIFSPNTTVVLPMTSSGIATSNVFAVVVNNASQIVLKLTASQTVKIVSMQVVPIKKVDLSSSTVVCSPAGWTETLPVSTPIQGVVSNLIDGDFSTEFRTKLGAPALTASVSLDLDYVVALTFNSTIPVDFVYLDFSYVSEWFRIDGTPAIPGETGSQCEWTPGLNSLLATSTSDCSDSVISIVESGNYYKFGLSQSPHMVGSVYWSGLVFTMMQASARDLIAGQPVLGVKELQAYSAYPLLVPLSVTALNASTSSDPSNLFDSNFSSVWNASAVTSNVSIVADLGSLRLVKQIEVWFSPSAVLAGIVVNISVSLANAACDASTVYQNTQSNNASTYITYTGSAGPYVPSPIRCIKIDLVTPASLAATFSVSEIIVKGPEPSYTATVTSSTLTNPAYALDGLDATESVALVSGGVSQHIMFDLVGGAVPVWGVAMILTGLGLEGMTVTLYLCTASDDFVACTTNGLSQTVPLESVSQYLFGPVLMCVGCTRVAIVLSTTSSVAGPELFRLNGLSVFASDNSALSATVVFDDDRGWDYDVRKSVDGDNTTAWVSETDITAADLVVSLIPDGEGYTALDPSYAATALLRPPTQVASIDIRFLFPVLDFNVSTSLDGVAWTPIAAFTNNSLTTVSIPGLVFANYIEISLTKVRPSQTPSVLSSGTTWWGPIYGVSEISVTTLSTLQLGKTAFANSTMTTSLADPEGLWMTFPPSARANYTMGSVGIEISGVHLVWLFPPIAYEVVAVSGGVPTVLGVSDDNLVVHTLIADPDVGLPGAAAYTATGLGNAKTVRVEISNYQERNGVAMAALSAISVYGPSTQYVPTVDAPALDDSPEYITDNDLVTNHYTTPAVNAAPVNITFTIADAAMMGKMVIYWNTVCESFYLSGLLRPSNESVVIYNTTSNAGVQSTILFALNVSQLTLTLLKNADDTTNMFSLFEVQLFRAQELVIQSSVQDAGVVAAFTADLVIDSSNVTQWMAAPGAAISPDHPVCLTVDLQKVYPVHSVSVVWGWTPFQPGWTGTQIDATRDIQISSDNVTYVSVPFLFDSDSNADESTDSLSFRYIRVVISQPYLDEELDLSAAIFGPSIRNIIINFDRNLARDSGNSTVPSLGWWDFPATLAGDGDNSTGWLSQRGVSTADFVTDLGALYDVAGIETSFRYLAGSVAYWTSPDCVTYTLLTTTTNNRLGFLELSGQTIQFQARCVKLRLASPQSFITNPDNPTGPTQAIFGILTLSVLHHVGGGGVFGIEANIGGQWGAVFDTITFAPFQPGQWEMLSNQQNRSGDVNGPVGLDEASQLQHIVVTFSADTVTIYRNGVRFGTPYTTIPIAWDMVEDVRLVFGVRSSAFVGASDGDILALMGTGPGDQVSTLNPFFSGELKSIALFSQELLPEEVVGLYEAAFGARERGCHCHDACPVGRSRYYPDIDVPCSAQGVCKRRYDALTGLPTTGVCACSPGFSGDNCGVHCSNSGGCCSVDDDCPLDKSCDVSSSRCV